MSTFGGVTLGTDLLAVCEYVDGVSVRDATDPHSGAALPLELHEAVRVALGIAAGLRCVALRRDAMTRDAMRCCMGARERDERLCCVVAEANRKKRLHTPLSLHHSFRLCVCHSHRAGSCTRGRPRSSRASTRGASSSPSGRLSQRRVEKMDCDFCRRLETGCIVCMLVGD